MTAEPDGALNSWSDALAGELFKLALVNRGHKPTTQRECIEVATIAVFLLCVGESAPSWLLKKAQRCSRGDGPSVVAVHLSAIAAARASAALAAIDSGEYLNAVLEGIDREDLWFESNRIAIYLRDVALCVPNRLSVELGRILHWLERQKRGDQAGLTLEDVGIASHLQPFSILTGRRYFAGPEELTLRNLLLMQASDGLFYPVLGGGACPELNVINLLIEIGQRNEGARRLVSAAFERYVTRMLREIGRVWLPENFRGQAATAETLDSKLPRKVRLWVTSGMVDGVDIYAPELWSTFIRYLSFKKTTLFLSGRDTSPTLDHYTQWIFSQTR